MNITILSKEDSFYKKKTHVYDLEFDNAQQDFYLEAGDCKFSAGKQFKPLTLIYHHGLKIVFKTNQESDLFLHWLEKESAAAENRMLTRLD